MNLDKQWQRANKIGKAAIKTRARAMLFSCGKISASVYSRIFCASAIVWTWAGNAAAPCGVRKADQCRQAKA